MYSVLQLTSFGDERGSLIALENNTSIPFAVRRVFYIYGTKDAVARGAHANIHSKFVLICVHGSCKVRIMLPTQEDIVTLDRPDKGLYLDAMVWKEMYAFTTDAVLLVLSDSFFDAEEYIEDYNEYVRKFSKLH